MSFTELTEMPLDVRQGLERLLAEKVLAPPKWELKTSLFTGEVIFKYPTFAKNINPSATVRIDSIDVPSFLDELTPDKRGYFPPYHLIMRTHKKTTILSKSIIWIWDMRVSAKQYSKSELKAKTFLLNQMGSLKRKKGKKLIDATSVVIDDLARACFTQLQASAYQAIMESITNKKKDTYQAYINECIKAYLHHLNAQRIKVVKQMSEIYTTHRQGL